MAQPSRPLAVSGRLGVLVGFTFFGMLALVAILTLLDRAGLPEDYIAAALVAPILLTYAAAGIVRRTMKGSEFAEGGSRLPADVTGMAAAADWLPGVALVALLGGLALDGQSGLAWLAGWIGGLMLMLTLVAPHLRRAGVTSLPDFLALRFGAVARLVGLVLLLATVLLLLVAELQIIAEIAWIFFGLTFETTLWLVLGAILVSVVLGGMGAVVPANATQYVVILIALLLPAALISLNLAGTIVPHFATADALRALGTAVAQPATGLASDRLNFIALIIVVMLGTAALPHMVGRYLVQPSATGVRRAVLWSIIFFALLVISIPVYAALARWQIQSELTGIRPEALPGWVYEYGRLGLVKICGADAVTAGGVATACLIGGGDGTIAPAQLWIDPRIVAVAAPLAAGLPFVFVALVAAGLLTAAMTTVNGVLLAFANSVGNDLYSGVLGQRASAGRRLLVARLAVVAAAAFAAWAVSRTTIAPLSLLAWTFNLAAAGLFPALVLGLWWPQAGRFGALAGIATGVAVTVFYVVQTEFRGMAPWGFLGLTDLGVSNHAAALFGLPAGTAVMIAVSLAVDARRRAARRPPIPKTPALPPEAAAG